MLSRVHSASLLGIDAYPVEVEVDISSRGLPHFSTVGLPDAAVKESKDRVRAALKNTGYQFPLKQITVNLAPADTKKEGSAFDLPIALGILAAEGIIPPEALEGWLVVGELSLDGRIKPVRGSLSLATCARQQELRGILIPLENALEAAVVKGVEVIGAPTLPGLIQFLITGTGLERVTTDVDRIMRTASLYAEDFADVKGQAHAKRSLEVAAAGGHNVLLIGPPGSGKSMLSRRLPTILPPMTFEEALETTRIWSASGLLRGHTPLLATRPFRSPHHTVSDVAMVGGGTVPKPGEISLSHHGVLFLDELPEFRRNVLEVLRQPLEDREITISRAALAITYPSSIMLVAACNPCPCGYLGDPTRVCSCAPSQIHRYRSRVSGPLLDRFDIHIEVPAVPYRDLSSDQSAESSAAIRERVVAAREIQLSRLNGDGIYANAQMRSRHIRTWCRPDDEARNLLERAMKTLGLSARAYTRILKVARTIADLEGAPTICEPHVSEAIQYRSLDREAT